MVPLPRKSNTPKVSDAIFTVNSNWELSSFNKAAEELFGLKSKDVLGKNCHDIFGSDERFAELFSTLCPSVTAGRIISDFNLIIDNNETNELKSVLARH